MRRTLWTLLAVSVLPALARPGLAQEVGDKVVVTSNDTKIKKGREVVATAGRGIVLVVREVRGEWLSVCYLRPGWIETRHVIPLDEAIGYFTAQIRRNPRDDGAYYARAIVWKEKGEYDIAIADYNETIRLDPEDHAGYNGRGMAWRAKGEYDKAIADHGQAIRLDPKDSAAYNGRAWLRATCPDARFRDGRHAVEDATRACELTGWKDSNDLDTLAACYAESGDFDAAVRWQTKAIEQAPQSQKADFRSRLELYRAGKPYREPPK